MEKGFGFYPDKLKNIISCIGKIVIIGQNVEIGWIIQLIESLNNTFIGDGTFLDNQVHIVGNVKIGKNCIIAGGQVGFAGSSSIGNELGIGGQTAFLVT